MKQIKKKVLHVLQRDGNQIEGQITDDMPVFLIEFKPKQIKLRSGRMAQSNGANGLSY